MSPSSSSHIPQRQTGTLKDISSFEELRSHAKMRPEINIANLRRAYECAEQAHRGQKRASGEPYITHPLAVCDILLELGADETTLVASLLHDTLEDAPLPRSEISLHFGEEAILLIEGVTKLSQVRGTHPQERRLQEAKNFQKFLLAVSQDIRILLIKLADRLHNMRTLHFMKSKDRKIYIARETLQLYAPLAERLGMQKIRNELEDWSFLSLYPEERKRIVLHLERSAIQPEVLKFISHLIEDCLRSAGLKAHVYGRQKQPYAIWRKISTSSDASFKHISDILGFRIILQDDDPISCYKALGILHTVWSFVPEHFKDYISMPKPNGYQSLHTTLIGPEKRRIEVQIRTQSMHVVAENGIAAHWRYKSDIALRHAKDTFLWLQNLLDILDNTGPQADLMDHTKAQMLLERIFCFTPQGRLVCLPDKATALDFAYQLSTQIGNTCMSCTINGKGSPLYTNLKNGDEIDIVTCSLQAPAPEWEDWVVTGKAKSAIARGLRKLKREKSIRDGEIKIQGILRTIAYEKSIPLEKLHHTVRENLPLSLGLLSYEELCQRICAGQTNLATLTKDIKKIIDEENIPFNPPSSTQDLFTSSKNNKHNKSLIIIDRLDDGPPYFIFSQHTHPLPGEDIVGVPIGEKKHILIQPKEHFFPETKQMKHIKALWGHESFSSLFSSRLQIIITDNPQNTFATIMTLTYAHGACLLFFHRQHTSATSAGTLFEIEIGVRNILHLRRLTQCFKDVSNVARITRPYRPGEL